MHKISSIIILVFFSFSACNQIESKKKEEMPNIILVLADDLGYGDLSCYGAKDINTPVLDQIAENGVKFTNGYTSYSVCGPSRAGFITGRYGQRFGFERNPQYRVDNPNMGLPKTEKTIAEHLIFLIIKLWLLENGTLGLMKP